MSDRLLRVQILQRLSSGDGFPIVSGPYCELAEALGVSEADALAVVLELRETREIARIGAVFADDSAIGFCSAFDNEELALAPIAGVEITCDEAELLMLLADDLPFSEHPYAELAAVLQDRGVDVDEDWVLERIGSWRDAGVISRFGAEAG